MKKRLIYSIGHSTLPINDFVQLLSYYQIKHIVDVRRFPTSKKYPQFQQDNLEKSLQNSYLQYTWLGDSLGGYRKGGYQQYMQSNFFKKGVDHLKIIATNNLTAFMCAEKLFFKCHRRFIADSLTFAGWQVIHIFDEKNSYPYIPADSLPLKFS